MKTLFIMLLVYVTFIDALGYLLGIGGVMLQ
jgi:hypothetical protein